MLGNSKSSEMRQVKKKKVGNGDLSWTLKEGRINL